MAQSASASRGRTAARAQPRPAQRPRSAQRPRPRAGGIRWDRVGRLALLAVLGVIMLLYIPPVKHWIEQSRTAAHGREELRMLQRENKRLGSRLAELRRPDAVEREARRLGMVREGERPYVIQPPARR